jgi:hypothetical protein
MKRWYERRAEIRDYVKALLNLPISFTENKYSRFYARFMINNQYNSSEVLP